MLGSPALERSSTFSAWYFNNWLLALWRMVSIELEKVAVVRFRVECAIVLVLEPVSGAFYSVDVVGAFILWFEFVGHVNFDSSLPN